MLAAHQTAARNRLTDHTRLAQRVYGVARVSAGGSFVQDNYVALSTTFPDMRPGRQTSEQAYGGDAYVEFYVTVVAVDEDGLYQFADAVDQQFIGHRLAVPGRVLTALEKVEAVPASYASRPGLLSLEAVYGANSSRPVLPV